MSINRSLLSGSSFIQFAIGGTLLLGCAAISSIVKKCLSAEAPQDFHEQLGPDISYRVFSYLDAPSLKNALLVCKEWNAFIFPRDNFQKDLLFDLFKQFVEQESYSIIGFNPSLFKAQICCDLESAKKSAETFSSFSANRTLAYLEISKVCPTYKDLIGVGMQEILAPICRVEAYLKIAKVYPNYFQENPVDLDEIPIQDPKMRALCYLKISKLNPQYFIRAINASLQIEDAFQKEETLFKIVKCQVKADLSAAKENVKLLTHTEFKKARIFAKIAKKDISYISQAMDSIDKGPNQRLWVTIPLIMKLGKINSIFYDLAKEMAEKAENQDFGLFECHYTKSRAYRKMARKFPEYLSRAKSAALLMESDYYRDKMLQKISLMESKKSLYEARLTIGHIKCSITRSIALAKIITKIALPSK